MTVKQEESAVSPHTFLLRSAGNGAGAAPSHQPVNGILAGIISEANSSDSGSDTGEARRVKRRGRDAKDGTAAGVDNLTSSPVPTPLPPVAATSGKKRPDGRPSSGNPMRESKRLRRADRGIGLSKGEVKEPEKPEKPEKPTEKEEEEVAHAPTPVPVPTRTPHAPKERPKRAAAVAALEKVAAEKAATEKAATEKAATEKAVTEKVTAEKTAAEKAGAEKAGTEKMGAEKTGMEKTGAEKTGAEKAGTEKKATEKAAAEKKAAEKAAAEKAAAEKASVEKAADDAPAPAPALVPASTPAPAPTRPKRSTAGDRPVHKVETRSRKGEEREDLKGKGDKKKGGESTVAGTKVPVVYIAPAPANEAEPMDEDRPEISTTDSQGVAGDPESSRQTLDMQIELAATASDSSAESSQDVHESQLVEYAVETEISAMQLEWDPTAHRQYTVPTEQILAQMEEFLKRKQRLVGGAMEA